jgi:exosome complex component RRP45
MQVVEPSSHRPAEGVIRYSVEFSPMAAPSFQAGRPLPAAVEVLRVVERALKESRAVETESLCIVAGEKVWAVRVDITVLDHCGNIADAVAFAALASLLHFRKPHVEVIGSEVTIHTLQSHAPDALSVHHRPVCVSFAFVGEGAETAAVDPSLVEEEVAVGSLTMALNVHRELCAVSPPSRPRVVVHELLF